VGQVDRPSISTRENIQIKVLFIAIIQTFEQNIFSSSIFIAVIPAKENVLFKGFIYCMLLSQL